MKKNEHRSNSSALKGKINLLETRLSAARGCGLSAEKLVNETSFLHYMRLLKGFSQRYSVMIAVCDTPIGPSTTLEETCALQSIGLKINLFQKYRRTYAAMLEAGTLLYEEIKDDRSPDVIDQKICLDDDEIRLVSNGAYSHVVGRKTASIQINGEEYCISGISRRGINIVVYDRVTKTLIDSVNFDGFVEGIPCIRADTTSNMVKDFAKAHPGVSVVCWSFPVFPTKYQTENEQSIAAKRISKESILNQYLDANGVAEVLSIPSAYYDASGVRHFKDVPGRYITTVGGHRVTAYQPKHFQHTIYLIGDCSIFGFGSDNNRTIASYLQHLLNEKVPDGGFIVQNYGCFLSLLDNRRDYDVFFDVYHYTPDGNRLIAEGLFQGLLDEGFLQASDQIGLTSARSVQNDYGFDKETASALSEYKKILVNWYQEMFGMTMGAVVMNCNPFTLGHRYLIEKALEQCDYLVIFAVQEDLSDFPFEDRLRLIDEGVADLKNVVVIPSGRFILSSLTFSGYFNKSEMQDRVVDTSLDVTVFAREIAPCLDIKKRFAGEEPFDSVTRQYNETMRKVLPEYGIEFIEIPRIEIDGRIISASRVRALLKEGNLDAIKPLVPESTFRYLCDMSSQK